MLLHCCYTVVSLLLHCCYTVVTLLLLVYSWLLRCILCNVCIDIIFIYDSSTRYIHSHAYILYIYIYTLYIQTYHEIVTHSTSVPLQWWLQWQAPWMRVSATWAQRATRRMTIRRMGIEMSKMCCPAVAKSFRWDLWVIGFVPNSERSANHKVPSWWTAQRHCLAPAKSCHLSTCGRQISPLQTRKRHRVQIGRQDDGRRNEILCVTLH